MLAAADRANRPDLRSVARHAFAVWLPLTAVASVLVILVYVAVQQDLRSGANDPQLEVAQDAAGRLATGGDPKQVASGPTIDMARSLAPFVIVLDASDRVVASTARLDSDSPRPPEGVMRAAARGRNVLTWQPRSGVRAAIVVQAWRSATTSGTVIAGRSLREVERRESELTLGMAVGWIGVVLTATGAALAGSWIALGGPLWPVTRGRRSAV